MSDIEVRVIRSPGLVRNVALPQGSTVSDALQVAGTSLQQNEVPQVNGTAGTLDTVLVDGDRIIMAAGAKGAR